MFESAGNMDAGEEEGDRHFVADLDALLNYEPEETALSPEDEQERRTREIEDMRRMASMVNDAMGGTS